MFIIDKERCLFFYILSNHSPAPSLPLPLKAATDPSRSERWPHSLSRTSGQGGSPTGGVHAGASGREGAEAGAETKYRARP